MLLYSLGKKCSICTMSWREPTVRKQVLNTSLCTNIEMHSLIVDTIIFFFLFNGTDGIGDIPPADCIGLMVLETVTGSMLKTWLKV